MTEPHAMSAFEMASLVKARELSVSEIADDHLARIEKVNPSINAIVHIDFERVRESANALDERISAGVDLGPLAGVPYGIKDLDDVAGSPTSYGVPFLVSNIASTSSVVAERMQAAGGLFVGKTNSPELGYRGTCSNHAFGATKNPWDLTRTPGGSSGGSAAAVAACLLPLADGSDGAGSIRIPASLCGTVGFKPSFGRVPAELGFAQSLVHHGPLARTVADAALMYSVVEGAHPRDPKSIPSSGIDLTADLDEDISGLRVAFTPGLAGFDVRSDVVDACKQAAEAFETDLGCVVEGSAPGWGDMIDVMWVLWQDFYGRFAPLVPAEAVRGMVDDDLLEVLEGGAALSATQLHEADAHRQAMWTELIRWFENYDYLVLPTLPITAFPDDRDHPAELEGASLKERILRWLMTFPFNLASACPVISVPCGFDGGGLPIGLSIVGKPWDDIGVLRAAAAFERARPWRQFYTE